MYTVILTYNILQDKFPLLNIFNVIIICIIDISRRKFSLRHLIFKLGHNRRNYKYSFWNLRMNIVNLTGYCVIYVKI